MIAWVRARIFPVIADRDARIAELEVEVGRLGEALERMTLTADLRAQWIRSLRDRIARIEADWSATGSAVQRRLRARSLELSEARDREKLVVHQLRTVAGAIMRAAGEYGDVGGRVQARIAELMERDGVAQLERDL